MRPPVPPPVRVTCDSLAALPPATRDGRVHFGKNSDRPELEAQPLSLHPRSRHHPGASLRCTYIDIPQVDASARVLGSRPYWCWGFEHGVNEHGVTIGNHTIFTKEDPGEPGLIGMDLVRLGLERGRTAADAVAVITRLIEEHGQGGSGFADKDWAYNNSFLVADRSSAYVLETCNRHWAWRRVDELASLSNHVTLGSDWQMLSEGFVEHAVARGWWPAASRALFVVAAACRYSSLVPPSISSGRHGRTCELLDRDRGHVDVATLRAALRDHYGQLAPSVDISGLRPEDVSVCMHAEPVGTTTASLIVAPPPDEVEPLVAWASLGSPCCSVFVPLRLDAELPASMTVGADTPAADSLWWQCKRLVRWVEKDWATRLSPLRTELDAIEEEAGQAMSAAIAQGDAETATRASAATVAALERVIAATLAGESE